jgi:two-component system repressor protein LuxO
MTEPRTILVVEDSATIATAVQLQLEPLGHTLLMAADAAEARAALRRQPVDCVLLDLRLPDADGIDLLDEIREGPTPPAVVVMTSNASLATAVRAVRAGAFDYLVKPFTPSRLTTTVQNALSNAALVREVTTFRRTMEQGAFEGFVGRSPAMQAVYRIIQSAAPSSASVFITGDSGTGKEVAAEALHRLSPRRERPFVALNCGAIPHDLLESTIFGHIKGSFTGATADQEGAAARADGGTLFLDELGEMDPQLQAKLLRFIQTGTYTRVGETRPRQADIRFVAATNRDPAEAMRDGRLREDLYYRLAVIPLHMPPLRDRGEDILLIARHFLTRYAAAEGRSLRGFAPEVEARLLGHPWPGNVRQLENLVRNIAVLHEGPLVTAEMLPLPGTGPLAAALQAIHPTTAPPPPATPANDPLPERPQDIEPLSNIERRYVEHAITLCGGNLQLAARRLGIGTSTIYRKREAWAKEA